VTKSFLSVTKMFSVELELKCNLMLYLSIAIDCTFKAIEIISFEII